MDLDKRETAEKPEDEGKMAAAAPETDKTTKRIVWLLIVIGGLFMALILYLTYFKLAVGDSIVNNAYNRRQWEKENSTLRGSITDRNGVVLAKSNIKNGKSERIYPFGSMYSQLIGYNSRAYGRTLLEAAYNDYLLGNTGVGSVFNIAPGLQGEKSGNSLELTIDHRLQKKASSLMEGKQGAVVAINPTTGDILAMVSKPDFDPNGSSLSDKWQELVESELHPFFPRATQGLYAPGSTFKMVTAAAAIESGLGDTKYKDTGSIAIDGKVFSNSGNKAYGDLDLKHAFAVSSNVFFAGLGVELGSNPVRSIAEKMGMNKQVPFDLSLKRSVYPENDGGMTKADMAASAIGQGKVLVTPLQLTLVTAAMANDGVVMEPRVVSRILAPNGAVVKKFAPTVYSRAVDADTAEEIAAAMREVVVSGTGKKAAVSGVKVAGKTGTAQNELTGKEKSSEHAWFTGFAPYENPRIAVTVILEYNGSTGGEAAAPIAAKLIKDYLGYAK